MIAQNKNLNPSGELNPQVGHANFIAHRIAVKSQDNLSQEETRFLGISKRNIINDEQSKGGLPLDALDCVLKL